MLRQLTRTPAFSLTVIVTLALSIGANTAIFSPANALLLKRLPYSQPDRLGTLYLRATGNEPYDGRRSIDGEQWEALRDNVPSLQSAVFAMRAAGVNLHSGAHVQYVLAGAVSAHYLNVLGVRPLLGRNFTEDEDRPGGPRTVILTYALWRSTFEGASNILGQSAFLKGEPYTIIGVLPERATIPVTADLYIPVKPDRIGEGRAANFMTIFRLRNGATWQQANSEMNIAWAQTTRVQNIKRANPGAQLTYYGVPLQQASTATLRPQVLALMLTAAFILFIACANLAGLMLVRISRRTGEIVTRVALGASRWRIVRQLWIENLLLSFAGGAAGIGVGFLSLRGLLLLLPENFLPVATVTLDTRVLAFTLSLSILTSLLFGMLPALVARRADLRSAIPGRGVIGAGSIRLRQILIASEVALTVVLLAGSGLLIRTLIHLQTLPAGFNANGVITAKASLTDAKYADPLKFQKLLREGLAAMRSIPGVENAGLALTLPYERALLDAFSVMDGKGAGIQGTTNEVYVTPGYFEALEIPLLAGRTFTEADPQNNQRVVIVNRTFARKFLHDGNPVGRHLKPNLLIVGVVGDTLVSSVAQLNAGSEPLTDEETIYVPAAQILDSRSLAMINGFFQPSWVVRTNGSVEGITGQMQAALAKVDPDLPFSGFYSMNNLMTSTLANQRVEVALLAAMASLALLLSAVGIFALVANMVAQRTREIGIRMALGSTIQQAMLHTGAPGAAASVLGLISGFGLCALVLRAMRSVLYGVSAYDATTLITVGFTLAAIAFIATLIPAFGVARIDPSTALREE
jgi:predicted permease